MPVPISPSPSRSNKARAGAFPRWLMPAGLLAVAVASFGFLLIPHSSLDNPSVPFTKPVGTALLVDITSSMPFVSPAPGLSRLDPAYLDSVLTVLEKSIGYNRKIRVALVANGSSAARDFDIPPIGTDLETFEKHRRICAETFPAIRAYLQSVMPGPQGANTDLVNAIERLSENDPDRLWNVIVASDGLQAAIRAAGALNLERQRVTTANVGQLIRLAAPERPLSGLTAASVQFVVPARPANDTHFANDVLSTRLFWSNWFQTYLPSANLYSFETSPRLWSDAGGCAARDGSNE